MMLSGWSGRPARSKGGASNMEAWVIVLIGTFAGVIVGFVLGLITGRM